MLPNSFTLDCLIWVFLSQLLYGLEHNNNYSEIYVQDPFKDTNDVNSYNILSLFPKHNDTTLDDDSKQKSNDSVYWLLGVIAVSGIIIISLGVLCRCYCFQPHSKRSLSSTLPIVATIGENEENYRLTSNNLTEPMISNEDTFVDDINRSQITSLRINLDASICIVAQPITPNSFVAAQSMPVAEASVFINNSDSLA